MYIDYFDEFGHNGNYVGRHDPSYKTHPVFGLGGFIIPADNLHELTKAFRKIKEESLKEEIEAKVLSQRLKVEHWEKKGSALLTTKNTVADPRRSQINDPRALAKGQCVLLQKSILPVFVDSKTGRILRRAPLGADL